MANLKVTNIALQRWEYSRLLGQIRVSQLRERDSLVRGTVRVANIPLWRDKKEKLDLGNKANHSWLLPALKGTTKLLPSVQP